MSKQKKRGQGEGSIYRLKDGRWAASVSLGWKPNAEGRMTWKQKVFTAKTRYEVAERLKKALRDQQRGINIDPERRTVAQFLNEWLAAVKANIAPRTYNSYAGTVRVHLIPGLGGIQLAKLGAHDIERFKQERLDSFITKRLDTAKAITGDAAEARHVSAATVRYCLVILRMALDYAVKVDLVPRNMAMLVDYPKVARAEIRPFSPEEAQRFLKEAAKHRLGAVFTVALSLGLRRGEALGLAWSAVDLERGTLSVRAALQRIKMPGAEKGKLVLGEPKRSSRRAINLPQMCLSALVKHRAQQEQDRLLAGTRWQDTGFVFTTRIGTPIEPDNLDRAFSAILRAARLPRIRIHDLRHTAATLLLAQGVHPRVVMELLGHSQIAVTMNTYSHVVPALRKDAAEKMDAILALAPVSNAVSIAPGSAIPN